jgi:hypothetical protein
MNGDLLLKNIIMYLYDVRRNKILLKKAHKMLSSCSGKGLMTRSPSAVEKDYKVLWKALYVNADKAWLRVYGSISGIWDHRYVPENIYYNIIEPCLNNKSFSKCYNDKNFYPTFLRDFNIPETLISNIDGIFYNNEHIPVSSEAVIMLLRNETGFIIKPAVDSGGGNKVTLWRKYNNEIQSNEGNVLTIDFLRSEYCKNYIIQKVIEQHSFFNRYNPTSVNTLRVLTYRSVLDESIIILHCIFRVGASGSITDNQASGGYACGVTDTGHLTGNAVDKTGNRFQKVNNVDLNSETVIEGFEKMIITSRDLASRYPFARLLGLDLCLNKEGDVTVLEVNNVNNEINFYQMLYGPLFKEHTDEVISYCQSHRRSFMIDFEV